MIGHRSNRRRLAIRHGLSLIEEERLRQHLEVCVECRSAAAEYTRQDASLRAMHLPEPPTGMREGVLARIGGETRARSPRHLSPSLETLAFLVAAIAIVVAALLHLHQSQRGAQLPRAGTSIPVELHGPPSPARVLAGRLGIQGMPAVGDQPNGRGKPWSIWFPRANPRRSLRAGSAPLRSLYMSGPALFSGPRGALGEFHYFNSTILRKFGDDRYRGPQLTKRHVVAIARAWFRRAGAPWPAGQFHVILRSGMTFIGGTGICCFHVLDQLYWGGQLDKYGIVEKPTDEIYIADRGTVVQVGIGPLVTGAYGSSQPCPGRTHRDRNGVALGNWCFDYASAVPTMIIADIGGHSPWVDDPSQIQFAAVPGGTPRHRVSLTDTRAVYTQTYRHTRYRLTVVPAFPGLPGSIWELVNLGRAR